MLLKVILLAGLVKLLISIEQPFLCAAIYAAARFVLGVFVADSILLLLGVTALVFVLAAVYFWLLSLFSESSLFWVVLIVGLSIVLV